MGVCGLGWAGRGREGGMELHVRGGRQQAVVGTGAVSAAIAASGAAASRARSALSGCCLAGAGCRMAREPAINKPANTIRPGEGKAINTQKSNCC